MSRIGKLPVAVPAGVEVHINENSIRLKGAKGELTRALPTGIKVERRASTSSTASGATEIVVHRLNEESQARANHGLVRALINNMVIGVSKGFEQKLDIQGVGFKSEVKGKALLLSLGYSHQVDFPFPPGIVIDVEKGTKLTVRGSDRQLVGETAAKLRKLREPDSYKGKGIRYEGEQIRLKQGKTAKK